MRAKLHLHSMIVHSVVALLALAAASWVLDVGRVTIGRFGPTLWHPLTTGALLIALLAAIPSTLTGVSERNRMYVRWHRTHRRKLILSLALIAALALELTAIEFDSTNRSVWWLGVLIVLVNNGVGLWLGALGLKITLGRQSFERTSYVPDMYQSPPIDILEVNAEQMIEPARLVDPATEEKAS